MAFSVLTRKWQMIILFINLLVHIDCKGRKYLVVVANDTGNIT